ncbi:zinc finger protein 436-like protein, partial [Lates japonicus]
MYSVETFERQIFAVMETLVDAAVSELGRLLEEHWAESVMATAAAQQRSAPAAETAVKSEEEEREVTQSNKAITNKFASLMEAWTKVAVEKISMMLKVSMSEAEDGLAVEQRVESNDKTKQTSMKPRAGRRVRPKKHKSESAARSSRQRRKKIERELKPATAAAADSESVIKP